MVGPMAKYDPSVPGRHTGSVGLVQATATLYSGAGWSEDSQLVSPGMSGQVSQDRTAQVIGRDRTGQDRTGQDRTRLMSHNTPGADA